MSVKMKFGSKDIPFVYKGDKLVYPNPIKDGLLLWYDFKGMRNTDVGKEVAKDLSGNGNDGTLTNFNFTEGSGYKDNTLVFDGVDDSLTIPELVLDETAMTVVHDGKIYSYEDDKMLTVGEDGEIVGGGKNLLLKSNRKTVSSDYLLIEYEISEPLEDGDKVVLTFKGNYGADKTATYLYNSGGSVNMTQVQKLRDYLGNDIFQTSFTWSNSTSDGRYTADSSSIRFYVAPSNGVTESSIEWAKLIKGSVKSIEWHSNPKDYKTTTLAPSSLTDLQLYNKTLRKDELLHNAESKGLKELVDGIVVQDGLMLHYDFSHESNTSEYKDKAFDYSGNGNHGVLTNFAYSDYSGYQNGGLEFDGVDDEVVIPYENNMFSVDFTWSAVIKPYTVDKDMMFMYGSTTAQYFRIQNGKLGASVRGQDSPVAYALTNFALDANTAYHVVVSHTNGDFKIYANGEQVGESDKGMKNERYRLSWLGKYTSADPRAFEGAILSAQVHNKALSAEEIAHNYAVEKEKFNIE